MSVVVVTGSRSLLDSPARLLIKEHFVHEISNLNPITVHHGGATGPDSWASAAFEEIQKVHRPVKTNSRHEAIQALFDRNKTMVDVAVDQAFTLDQQPIMVACWDGKSNGTRDAFEYAQSLGVPVVFTPVTLCEVYEALRRG